MKYAVLGPIGLIEFLVRIVLLAFPIFIQVLCDEWDTEDVNALLKPYCWVLLEEPRSRVNLDK